MIQTYKKKLFSIASTLLLLVVLLSGCIEKPQEEVYDGEWEGKEEFVASDRYTENVKKLEEAYEDYLDKASLGFAKTEPTGEECFTVEEISGGVRITKYSGTDKDVIIPETIGGLTVKEIGEGAFASATARAISVPDSVERIGKGAFENCENLTSIRLPFIGDGGENTNFGYVFGAGSYQNHYSKVPLSLDMVIIGGKVEKIAENAFAGCKSISSVALSDSVREIGDFAFYECSDLVYFDADNLIETVGKYAFGHCPRLFSANFESAKSIGEGAFYSCTSLRVLSVPFVGGGDEKNSFLGYIFGAEVADYNDEFVPASLYTVKVSGCSAIPDRAFASCKYIGEIYLGDSVESIGTRAFYSCRSITSIALPDSVKNIGDDAFFGCDNLTSIDFGSGVENIGMQAFFGCRALKSVEIPDKVTKINASTFALCESLEAVELNNVKQIGKDAFRRCDSLSPMDCSGIDVADGNDALVGKIEE